MKKNIETITEQEFRKLCDDIYKNRHEYYPLNPNVSHREALLWMLLGSLVNLLSVPIMDRPRLFDSTKSDPYGTAVIALVKQRSSPEFDPSIYITELSEKLESDA